MKFAIVTCLASMLMASAAVAQTAPAAPAAAAPATTSAAAPAAKKPVVRTAKSLECSKQADAKGLHGKPRKGFMSTCKKA